MYCSSEYAFICFMFSVVMAAVLSGFSVWVLITVVLCLLRRLANAGWELKWSEMRHTRIREILMAGYEMS